MNVLPRPNPKIALLNSILERIQKRFISGKFELSSELTQLRFIANEAEQMGHALLLANTYSTWATFIYYQGQLKEAETRYLTAYHYYQEAHNIEEITELILNYTTILMLQFRFQDAWQWIEKVIGFIQQFPIESQGAMRTALTMKAQLCTFVATPQQGLTVLDELESIMALHLTQRKQRDAIEQRERSMQLVIWQLRVDFLSALGRIEEAQSFLDLGTDILKGSNIPDKEMLLSRQAVHTIFVEWADKRVFNRELYETMVLAKMWDVTRPATGCWNVAYYRNRQDAEAVRIYLDIGYRLIAESVTSSTEEIRQTTYAYLQEVEEEFFGSPHPSISL